MKYQILLLLTTIILSCNAQNENEFEYDQFESQFLAYTPVRHDEISEKDFNYGSMIINETKLSTKNNSENFNLGDYFNILSAFLTLKESEENINMAFKKFENADGSCEYVIAFEQDIQGNPKYDIIRPDYLEKLKACKNEDLASEDFDIEAYCQSKGLDLNLVKNIYQIKTDDVKHRLDNPTDWSKQTPLDDRNQELIDSLFNKFNTYIGKSLVGDKFENVMWAVIQHSNVEMMERYLSVVQKAVEEKELELGPFKMLIDRYHGLKYGYQIFGSQSGFGFELADDKTRKEIESKYGIE